MKKTNNNTTASGSGGVKITPRRMTEKRLKLDNIYMQFNELAVYNRYVEVKTDKYYLKLFKDHPDDCIVRVKLIEFVDTGDGAGINVLYYKRRNIEQLDTETLKLIDNLLTFYSIERTEEYISKLM